MTRDEAIQLLRSGSEGVREWNQWRAKREPLPSLNDADLKGANLSFADLIHADLSGAYLSGADLSNAYLSGANLSDTNLSGANLSGADLISASLRRADLRNANLTHADLSGAGLRSANLTDADLGDANLIGADLCDADLGSADLSHANLSRADFQDANLSGAKLRSATIFRSNFHGTALDHANFERVFCGFTVFADVDLSTAEGLETVLHNSASTIGIDTIIRSGGKIPEPFLRGCGVPDEFIRYIPSLIGSMSPIQFYSCFISYSHKDEAFCQRLHSRLRDKHLRVWFAPEDMKGGKKLIEQIDLAIRVHDKLLLVLSEQSMKSDWVATEIYKARQREKKEGRQVLFPIRLCGFEAIRDWECFDADTGKDMAREIREYFVPDFSNWKDHDSFEKGFARLLKDLQAAAAPGIPPAPPPDKPPSPE